MQVLKRVERLQRIHPMKLICTKRTISRTLAIPVPIENRLYVRQNVYLTVRGTTANDGAARIRYTL